MILLMSGQSTPIPYAVVAITNRIFPLTLENTSKTSAFLLKHVCTYQLI